MTASRYDIVYVGFLLGHGGDAIQMQLLADGVHRRGARVKVIVPEVDTSIGFADKCEELGLECERTPLIRSGFDAPNQDLRAMVRLVRQLRSETTHFHTGNSCLPRVLMATLAVLRAPKAYVTIQSPYETIEPSSWRGRFWGTLAARRCHAVVSPSDHGSAFQRACGVPAERAVTLRNSINVEQMSSGDGDGPRRELGLGPEQPLVVFTSRLDGQKRPVDAVDIFAGISEEFADAHLAFVGTGSESEAVLNAAAAAGVADRVHLLGHRTDIADWLAAATVWILPTERENFSVAVLEALAAGCAVLSTPCRGNDEVLVDDVNALVFAIGDVDGGRQRLRRLLADPELRRRLGHAGRETGSRYTVEHMVDSYADLYRRFGGPSVGEERGTGAADTYSDGSGPNTSSN